MMSSRIISTSVDTAAILTIPASELRRNDRMATAPGCWETVSAVRPAGFAGLLSVELAGRPDGSPIALTQQEAVTVRRWPRLPVLRLVSGRLHAYAPGADPESTAPHGHLLGHVEYGRNGWTVTTAPGHRHEAYALTQTDAEALLVGIAVGLLAAEAGR
jgi:hypothetical protein